MKNTYGSALALTIFGESHGAAIGAVLDGMAAGVPVDEARVAACMDKRRARGDGLSTARVEADQVQFLSGVVNGHTTGTAIALMIENQNTRSGDYAKTADLLRPGHADYTAYAKYHGFQDARGGGHFSGRVTAALVAGGAIVLDALSRAGIDISTHIARCAGISDTPFALDDPAALAAQAEALVGKPEGFALLDTTVEEPMKAAIRAAGADGDSVGGILETAILGLPAGLGEPYFDSVESLLAHAAFSIPAVKGIKGRRTVGLFHGECVALGMLPMIESKALQKRVRAVYRRIGLPTRTTYNKEKVLAEMLHDKKAQGGQITVIKVPGLGCWRAETIPVEGLRPLLGVEE